MGLINSGQNVTRQDLSDFEKGWTDFMVDIWHERMAMLGINDTGTLRRSVEAHISGNQGQRRIIHRFVLYGIYVSSGVGRGYSKDNGGNLDFLDPAYREEHGLNKPRKKGPAWGGGMTSGKPRQKREWFPKKYFYSIKRLMEKESQYYGEAYNGTLVDAFATLFDDNNEAKVTRMNSVINM